MYTLRGAKVCVQVSMELMDTYAHCFNNIRFQRVLHVRASMYCTCTCIHLVYVKPVVCHAYSLLMRANKLEAALSRVQWLVWPHHDTVFLV